MSSSSNGNPGGNLNNNNNNTNNANKKDPKSPTTTTTTACKSNQQLLATTSNTTGSSGGGVVVLNEFLAETYENLFKFKNESLFTDVQIYVEGVEFACHKVVLCAASAYFRAMFTCDLKEARHGKVFIENISPWTMKRLLDFIYTGRVEIAADTVIDLFNAALLFQLHAVVDKCIAYIQANIDMVNCVEINMFASMHDLASLETCTFKFMLENFMQLVNLSLVATPNNSNSSNLNNSTSAATAANASTSTSSQSSHHHTHHQRHLPPANTPTSIMNALLLSSSSSDQAATSSTSTGNFNIFIGLCV